MSIVYITRKIPEVGLKLLKDSNIEYDIGKSLNPPSKKQLINELKKKPYDGVISFLTDKIDKDIFDACPKAKVFANYAVGFNNIDIEEAKKRGIEISNTPGTSSLAVAEHTVALMLALTTRLVEGDKFMHSGKYKGWDPYLLIGTDMKGKTIGLIGAGSIGTEVAKILYGGFNSSIIYSDPTINEELEKHTGAIRKTQDEILKEADIISIHVPLLPTTHHLINKDSFLKMKKTAFLVNTSRGPVVDEKALVDALKNNIIAGGAVDVYEFEPKLTKGLNKLKNLIMTPHIASSRQTARNMMSEVAVKNIISVLNTGKVINSVIK